MDNSQFRNLLQNDRSPNASGTAPSPATFKKPALGSRSRPSVPMTPRSVAGYNSSQEFARQVAGHTRDPNGQPPTKKFRSSAAPKGTKLASGYNDRTLARRTGEDGEETQDDKEKRLKALEEMFKLQQIDEATFEQLKSEIGIGGNVGSTHLVKGLDWKLLERVRRGEDINKEPTEADDKEPEAAEVDVDDELDQILQEDVQAKAPPSRKNQTDDQADEPQQELPRTRDEILRRLKEARSGKQASPAVEPPAPVLGDRFKKLTSEKSNKQKFVESINGRRREVLVITGKDGTTKRKTRWIDPEEKTQSEPPKEPLGMQVPAEFLAKQQALLDQQAAEDEDDDIFQGINDYDPLAGIHSDSEESDREKETKQTKEKAPEAVAGPSGGNKPRNYFTTTDERGDDHANPIAKDPTLLAALKRAAALQRSEEGGGDDAVDSDPDRAAKHKQLLARVREQERADAADMDLGFGGSRFEDEDEAEGELWDDGEGGGEENGKGKKSGRKRGKKRKGDKDNVNDVMAVLEGRGKKP